jgi:hypothetical protein
MSLFRTLTRAYLINRMARGGGRGRAAQRYRGYRPAPRAFARGSRSRTGFFGPFPYHSRRTRRGSQVTVSGCCLPIPLGLFGALVVGTRLLLRR